MRHPLAYALALCLFASSGAAEESLVVHYVRGDGDYEGWGLHVWLDVATETSWTAPLLPTNAEDSGLRFEVVLAPGAKRVGLIVHRGDSKDPGPDQFAQLSEFDGEVWIVSGDTRLYRQPPDPGALRASDLRKQKSHLLSRRHLIWDDAGADAAELWLHASSVAALQLGADGVQGADFRVRLEPRSGELPTALAAAHPHLAERRGWVLEELELETLERLARSQLLVSSVDASGAMLHYTGVQIYGLLDDLFATDRPLGAHWSDSGVRLAVWAPTAQSLRLFLYDTAAGDEVAQTLAMQEREGIWEIDGPREWAGRYYLYEVRVFAPATASIETNLVTDPYARGLAANGRRSLLVDLEHPETKPEGWDELRKPSFDRRADAVLYELHIRDFSARDESVPEELRGGYLAFTVESEGTRHLDRLAEAGVSHLHLLPSFDFATIDEDRSSWPSMPPKGAAGAGSRVHADWLSENRGQDGYNWGYDPQHYGVPEGSYASDPNGITRIVEYRSMVLALARRGLRVVMDVVYNHTNAAGQDARSVLDRLVPGYYHRLDDDGNVLTSTCCPNTASERRMMGRLLVDDLIHWAVDYKIDGFRFDLMGHHMRADIVRARDALAALRPESDGVDGAEIVLYGEGWDFGEVEGGRRGVNATQRNMAGTGVATFNDRLRDAVRGGNPFGDRREQGFASGLALTPNGFQGDGEAERNDLLEAMDRIRIGLAGNLAAYRFRHRDGFERRGDELSYGGYTEQPSEAVSYVSAHDNETLFDKLVWAAPGDATLDELIRMQVLSLGVVLLSQGTPFLHAGSELLRSKSLDADSYDSGDAFNAIDWSGASNNFAVGLPPAERNQERWEQIGDRLAREDWSPGRAEIVGCEARVRQLLRVRRSSPLFRLGRAERVQSRVHFHNTGPAQIAGLIVMGIDDPAVGEEDLDPAVERMFVVFNAAPQTQIYRHPGLRGRNIELHPLLSDGPDLPGRDAAYDSRAGTLSVPGRSASVFVERP